MQNAVIADSAIINDVDTLDVEYVDNSNEVEVMTITDQQIDDLISGGYSVSDIRKQYVFDEHQILKYGE